jgi:hypothetical protein
MSLLVSTDETRVCGRELTISAQRLRLEAAREGDAQADESGTSCSIHLASHRLI